MKKLGALSFMESVPAKVPDPTPKKPSRLDLIKKRRAQMENNT